MYGNGNIKIGSDGGRRIIDWRSPFSRGGEIIVRPKDKGVTLEDKACTHNMDADFEVPQLTFKLTALAEGAVCDPQPTVLDRFITVNAMDLSRNLPMGDRVPLTAVGNGMFQWKPTEPFVMRRGDSWRIYVNARDDFEIAFEGKRRRIDEIRIEITFEGDLLYYAMRPDAMPSRTGVENPLG